MEKLVKPGAVDGGCCFPRTISDTGGESSLFGGGGEVGGVFSGEDTTDTSRSMSVMSTFTLVSQLHQQQQLHSPRAHGQMNTR